MTKQLHLDITDRLQLGIRLKVLREGRKLTALQAAECLLGCSGSATAVSRLEHGALKTVPVVHLKKLAQGYGVTFAALTQGIRVVSPDSVVTRDNLWQPSDITAGVALRLRDLRQAMGLTFEAMGELLGHSGPTQVRAWETSGGAPRLESLLDIAARAGVCVSWLVKGSREGLSSPTQSARLRALRANTGLSRPALSMKADPTRFKKVQAQLAAAEAGKRALRGITLDKMAIALDVPVQWLTPPKAYDEAASKPIGEADVAAPLSASVRALIRQIKDLSLIDEFSTADAAALSKSLTERACDRLYGKNAVSKPLQLDAKNPPVSKPRGRPRLTPKTPALQAVAPTSKPRGRPRLAPKAPAMARAA